MNSSSSVNLCRLWSELPTLVQVPEFYNLDINLEQKFYLNEQFNISKYK
jgi:hypothetical protein